ncbi:MAG: hypothetical protein KDE27_32220 [Planctomycetes bacterium]|nr:hypothetical protein [Planctomycetota bacterium]
MNQLLAPCSTPLLVAALALSSQVSAQYVAWAYVQPAGQPASFTPNLAFQYSPTGTPISVSRDPGTQNRYYVYFHNASQFGVAEVSAATGSSTAVVRGWNALGSDVAVHVETFDVNGGPAANAGFTIRYREGGPLAKRSAYLWADQPTAGSYTPNTNYSWNGSRPDPTITRMGTGRYTVRLPGLAATGAEFGHVQVTPYSSALRRAKVAGWNQLLGDVLVDVRCFDGTGNPTDAAFVLGYDERAAPIAAAEGSGAHVWGSQPTLASYAADPSYADSNGVYGPPEAESITRLGTGSYRVHLPNVTPSASSTALVSAYGVGPEFATLTGWSSDGCDGTFVNVITRATSGNPVDARFTLQFVTNRPAVHQQVAWAWVDPAGQPNTFAPSLDYQFTTTGDTIVVSRIAGQSHRYVVRMPGTLSPTGTVQAVAYGGNHTAVVRDWFLTLGELHARIDLYDAAGNPAPANARFTVHYRSGGNDRDREAYLWANQESAVQYTPAPAYSWNANRADPTIHSPALGYYEVTLPGLGGGSPSGERGNVQVATYGDAMRHAQVERWYTSGADLVVAVRCRDAAGNPADSKFVLAFQETASPISERVGSGSHVWAGMPSAANYAPDPFYTDSNGTTGPANAESIQRIALGRYRVTLPNVAPSGSTVLATAYGTTARYATVASWGSDGASGTVVRVDTFSATGQAADAPFTLLYLTNRPADGELATNATYGNACNGPLLTALTRPISCNRWQLALSGVPTGAAIGFVQLGLSNPNTPFGAQAPGCTQLTDALVSVLVPLPAGSPTYSLLVPADPTFVGLTILAQGGALVPGLNPLGLAASQGVLGVIGDV